MINSLTILQIDKLKREYLPSERLKWSDLVVLAALEKLSEDTLVRPNDLIDYLKMDRGWVYGAIRTLEERGVINVVRQPNEPMIVGVNGWGRIFFSKINEFLNDDPANRIDSFSYSDLRSV